MDYAVHSLSQIWTLRSIPRYDGAMETGPAPKLTDKGAATRERIVRAAADLVLERGSEGTSLDDIRAATTTSKSQLFHYFPHGKSELVSAIVAFQGQRVLDAQQPYLDHLDTWASWEGWREALLAHYSSQAHLGCPIGALAAELIRSEPDRAAEVVARMEQWREYLEAGIARMTGTGLLRPDTDPRQLSLAVFAALQGGLTLAASLQSIEPLHAALDGALASLRAHATSARDPGGLHSRSQS
jgi:AcrR family transcriptional regulator